MGQNGNCRAKVNQKPNIERNALGVIAESTKTIGLMDTSDLTELSGSPIEELQATGASEPYRLPKDMPRIRRVRLLGTAHVAVPEESDNIVDWVCRLPTIRNCEIFNAVDMRPELKGLAKAKFNGFIGKIGPKSVKTVSTWHELEMLDCAGGRVTDSDVQAFCELPNLKALGLFQARVTDRCIPTLAKLDAVSLMETQVTARGVQELIARNPNIGVRIEKEKLPETMEMIARFVDHSRGLYH